jgi:hypothetical protein
MWIKRAVVGALFALCAPVAAMAEGPAKPGPQWGTVYPYKDLPGVKAPEIGGEKFRCWTRVAEFGIGYHYFERAYPRLVYVCEQNGVISESTRPPNYSYWQYNDRNR